MPTRTCGVGRAGRFVEALDARLLFNASYFPLANGPLLQDWSNTSLIQTINNWSNVPSIEGYRGSTLGVTATATNPQTVLVPNDPSAPTIVDFNRTTLGTSNSGGVAEFQFADPVVAIQGGEAGPAPHLLIYLNTLNLTDPIPVSYLLRDIDTQTTKAIQPIAAQYRIGSSGNFINIPAAFVADAAGVEGAASKVTPVNFTLPEAALGQPQVQLRIITTNAEGDDEWIGIDNLNIGTVIPKTIQLSQASLQVNESEGAIDVTLTRAGDLSAAAQVMLNTADVTALAGQDYTAVSQPVNFAAGQSTRSIALMILNDSTSESAERFSVSLSSATGAILGVVSQATVTIVDNDSIAPTGLLINEISVDPPGAVDSPYEFAELRGTASTPLYNVYLVQFEGDLTSVPGKSGVADVVFDLGATGTGANGMLLIKGAGGFDPADASTAAFVSSILTIGADTLENDAQTWQLIFSPIPIIEHYDYDPSTSSGGSLNLPIGAVVLDSVGWHFSNGSFVLYSDAVLNSPNGPIGAATRLRNNITAQTTSAWYFGALMNVNGSASLAYDASVASANLPAGAVLTPGAPNYTSSADVTPPTVLSVDWQFDLVATPPAITVTFSEPVHNLTLSNLGTSSFTVFDRSTNSSMPGSGLTLTQVSSTICRIGFAGDGIPDSGDFRLVINAANVKDLADNPLAEDRSQDFSFLCADATNDRRVDTLDFNLLAGHFAETSSHFSNGDFNFDGTVDSIDFTLLTVSFGLTLSAPAIPAAALFGGIRIQPDSDPPIV